MQQVYFNYNTNMTINNLDISNGAYPLYADNANYVKISNSRIYNGALYGIYTQKATAAPGYWTLDNVQVYNN